MPLRFKEETMKFPDDVNKTIVYTDIEKKERITLLILYMVYLIFILVSNYFNYIFTL